MAEKPRLAWLADAGAGAAFESWLRGDCNAARFAVPCFTWQKLFRSIESSFDTGALLYCVVVLLEHALVYYKRYQVSAVRASQLQTQLVQTQLQALKMQLHPHFLFNTLHTITALVREDPDEAERTIVRLGELFAVVYGEQLGS